MEKSLEQIVAANLTELRRAKQWTQADLAEKINYSDKSVSKWERGEGLPDLKVLKQLADLYGVTLDTMVTDHGAAEELAKAKKKPSRNIAPRVIMELLAVSVIFLFATVVYVLVASYAHANLWTVFVWAMPISFGLLTLFNIRWKFRVCAIVFASLLAWSLLTAVYLQALQYNIWMLFLVGVPAQAAIILGAQLKHKKNFKKGSQNHENGCE